MLMRLIQSALKAAKSTGSLVLTVVISCIGINIIAADQYISIVLPGKMYKAEFQKRGLDAKNLSRVIEDSGTLTSPLVPWNTCGAYMAATLGVATLAYLPFVFFNLINPVVSVIYGYTGFTIRKIEDVPEQALPA
jgi:NhaC family Na+:H+ antiporter